MMRKWMISLFAVSILLSGCSSEDDKATADKTPSTLTEVKVKFLTPEKNSNQTELLLQVEVTQGKEKIEDATSVQFEIWPSGERKTNAQLVDAKYVENGIYEATAKVKADSVYYAYAHTEARGLHVMPKQKFIIGQPDLNKVQTEK
ncbi:MAG: FixH family protein [Kurthia sp.]|nr:FixH family protein [Candidatus Kurthia equi]